MQQDAWLLMQRPADDFECMFEYVDIQGVIRLKEISVVNSPQKAYLAKTIQGVDEIRISYGFKPALTPPSDDFWLQQSNRYTFASQALKDEAEQLLSSHDSESGRIIKIIEHAA